MNRRNDNEPYSFHPAGAIFLFADGHVNFISESISIPAISKLVTRSGNEVISDIDY
jgi:prepilin-type processing-associated H-X9-DG protein